MLLYSTDQPVRSGNTQKKFITALKKDCELANVNKTKHDFKKIKKIQLYICIIDRNLML